MRRWLSLVAVLPLSACGVFAHLSVEPLATSFSRPSNVAALLAVSDGETGLTELSPSSFRVYEDGQLVASDQTELTLLDPMLVAQAHTVLLVDMSGATTPEARAVVARAAHGFVEKVTRREAVSVLAFDGAAQLVPIATFPRGDQKVSLAALESYTPRDTSRNLNGAVVAGLSKLTQALAQGGKVVRLGTLVVYAAGPDAARRVSADDAHDAVWASPYEVIAIGVADNADPLENLARTALIRAQADSTVPIAFEEAADKTIEQLQKHYLVSFCSPARAGSRQLRIEVTYSNPAGEERRGDFETEFNANGFGPGCNPLVTPRLTLVPRATPEKKGDSPSKGKGDAAPAKATDAPQDQSDDAPVAPPEHSGYAK
jgi:hypothetical protein